MALEEEPQETNTPSPVNMPFLLSFIWGGGADKKNQKCFFLLYLMDIFALRPNSGLTKNKIPCSHNNCRDNLPVSRIHYNNHYIHYFLILPGLSHRVSPSSSLLSLYTYDLVLYLYV